MRRGIRRDHREVLTQYGRLWQGVRPEVPTGRPETVLPYLRLRAHESRCSCFGGLWPGHSGLAKQVRCLDSPEEMAAATAAYFAQHLPALDSNTELATALVNRILHDPTILSVKALSKHSGQSIRSLQRLFREYVGASPKWVVRRFRLHELLERFHSGEEVDGAQLALELGYADQAHLINDFRKLAGVTPTEYFRRADLARSRTVRP